MRIARGSGEHPAGAVIVMRIREFARRPAGELSLAGLGLALLGALALGSYLRRGGFSYDDWSNQALVHFQGFGALASLDINLTPGRPLAALYFPVVHSLLGVHEHWHLALAAGLRIGVSLALFMLLRELRLDRLSAIAAAALALLFPYSDADLWWSAAGQVSLSVTCWLLGALVALRGLRSPARGQAWHAIAIALYLASLLLYEIALIVILLTGALYLARAPRRAALGRWAADVAAVALTVVLFTSRLVHVIGRDGAHSVQGVKGALRHLRAITDQGLTVGASALAPFGAPGRLAVATGALLLVAAGAVVAWRTSDRTLRGDLVRWLQLAGGGVAVTLGGWAILAPADPYYSPQVLGIGNRINALAGVGLAVLAVALVRLASGLAFGAVPRDRRRASAVVTALVLSAVGGVYLDRLGADRGAWERARRQQGIVLARLSGSMSPPRAGTTLIARGFDLYAAPGVPVFAASWDLNGAVQLLWHDPTLRAWPSPPGSLTCTAAGVAVAGVSSPGAPARYGQAILIDVATGESGRIDTADQCRALARPS